MMTNTRTKSKKAQDAEDKKDGGRDDALENADGQIVKGVAKSNRKTVDDPEDLKDGGADEAAEDGFGKQNQDGNKPNPKKTPAKAAKDKTKGGTGRAIPPQFLARNAGRF